MNWSIYQFTLELFRGLPINVKGVDIFTRRSELRFCRGFLTNEGDIAPLVDFFTPGSRKLANKEIYPHVRLRLVLQ